MRYLGDGRATAPMLASFVLLAACTLPPLETATPSPSPSPTTTPSPTASPTEPPASPSAEPTPDPGAIPDFAAGEIVASLIDGLRVRQRPGVDATMIPGLLPLNAELEVVMGPFPVDDFGWYLVRDVDPGDPDFTEGWVAAGYEPDPFLRATGRAATEIPYVVAMAASGDAEEGPIEIGEGDHAIRWIARDPEGVRCTFAVSLAPPGDDPVQTIRATVGSGIDRGTLQPQTFDSLGVRGTAFVSVVSDCAWALVMLRVPQAGPDASSSPAP
jgi:hypothetical protein